MSRPAHAPVSAVIPCFRCRATIRRAVASVAGQSLVPAELILVDDASGDGTLELLRDLRSEFGERWVKLISLGRNSGPSGARNAGWDAASSEYVAFLDADDAWHPRKTEIQHAFMEVHPEVALCGHGYRRLAGGESGEDIPIGRAHHSVVTLAMLLRSNRFVTPSVMLKRDIPLRFLEGRRYMEDHLLWLEVAASGRQIARLEQKLAFTYKASVGESGLSAGTWEMRKAELANLWRLRRAGSIGLAAALALSAYSLAKHCARAAFPQAGRGT